ncbi:MAG: transglycosylase SLT domain-containing protein [Deltaproteobacteria bacterium]|nr:transglycosylase SLT domain-containing protein [Deltaproteobacteria bacterium]
MSYIDLSRRAWIFARGLVVGSLLLTVDAAFMPVVKEPAPVLSLEEPYQETRSELLRALDKHAKKRLSEMEKIELADIVAEVAFKYGVDPFLILGVMAVESEFYDAAKSSVGALGFMQLRPSTAFEWSGRLQQPMHVLGLYDWRTNIELGAAYLRFLRDRMGSWPMALASYNWGPTTVKRAVKEHGGLPKKMRGYERRVSKAYQRLVEAAGAKQNSAPLAWGPVQVRSAI